MTAIPSSTYHVLFLCTGNPARSVMSEGLLNLLGCCLTDTFSGIRPTDVGGFVLAQLAGSLVGFGVTRWLFALPVAIIDEAA